MPGIKKNPPPANSSTGSNCCSPKTSCRRSPSGKDARDAISAAGRWSRTSRIRPSLRAPGLHGASRDLTSLSRIAAGGHADRLLSPSEGARNPVSITEFLTLLEALERVWRIQSRRFHLLPACPGQDEAHSTVMTRTLRRAFSRCRSSARPGGRDTRGLAALWRQVAIHSGGPPRWCASA